MTRASGRPLRLLVVDDEQQILELLALTLELQGFTVTPARSGPDALASLAGGPLPDLIVMDVLMAPWDGFETVRRLHDRLGNHLPPVVFLSGLNRPPTLPAGVTCEYLVKPFRPSELVACLRRLARPQD
ncbi:response regulator [Deinococcus sp. MIMF12]|uniref:Response regulator n=1 Tax=Deinococcus rhizophilus TaxID=3049544 RepID=A0ABT7JKU7_9DEIO|nr:response regulator [Deinococcus rhizophilus]MDL2345681.1 response regulator [Deinococcus rhizophilus]